MRADREMKFLIALALSLVLIAAGCSDDDNDLFNFGPGAQPDAALRVAHLSPDAPMVDVWVDGGIVLENVPFQAVSDYLILPAGTYRVQVTPAGATEPVVIDINPSLFAGTSYTAAATGLLNAGDLQPLLLQDDVQTTAGMAEVRFVHTSPDAPAVDVAVKDGPILFAGVAFREDGGGIPVAPGTYDLEVRLAGTGTVALSVPGVQLDAGLNYTIFAVGLAADGSLAALPVVDAP